jgi:hypothetical protein
MPALVTEPNPCFACSYGMGCRVERNVAASECERQLNAVGCAELLQSLGLLHSQFVCNRHLSKSVAAMAWTAKCRYHSEAEWEHGTLTDNGGISRPRASFGTECRGFGVRAARSRVESSAA